MREVKLEPREIKVKLDQQEYREKKVLLVRVDLVERKVIEI